MWVHDRLIKIECHSCAEEFLVSEYVLKKKTDKEYPGDGCYCPYCGNTNTEAVTWTGEEPSCMNFAEEMGCLAISHPEIGEGEELHLYKIRNEDTGEETEIEAVDFIHAVELFRRKGNWGVKSITGDRI